MGLTWGWGWLSGGDGGGVACGRSFLPLFFSFFFFIIVDVGQFTLASVKVNDQINSSTNSIRF